MDQDQEQAPSPGLLRRIRWPILLLAPWALLSLLGMAMNRLEFALEHYITVMMFSSFAMLLGLAGVVVWFVFFSGINLIIRLAGVAILASTVLFLIFTTARVEFDGNMTPRFIFVWQKTGEQKLNEYLSKIEKSNDAVNLVVGPTDSALYRGPKGDGFVSHLKLNSDWAQNAPKQLWRHPVGIGHGGVSIAGNSAITLEQRGNQEMVVCYDRTTGKERWIYGYEARFTQSQPMGGDGPRTTPVIHEGAVITLGATGELACIDGSTGKNRWQTNIIKDAGAENIDWGMSGSPIVVGNVVVVNPGANKDRSSTGSVAGYDLSTGKKLWATANRTSGYSSPMQATLGGVKQVLVFDALALAGFDPQTGAELWKHEWKTEMNMNSVQPLIVGENRVFISSEKRNGGAVVEVKKEGDKWTTAEVWNNRAICARFANPVLVKDHIYGLNDGRLVCVEAASGKRKWAEGSFGNGQILATETALIITAESGKLFAVAADPTEFNQLGELFVFDARTWNVPAIAGNQLFMRNHEEIAVFELAEAK
jgi:outer membrane protein assembly factor BamB